MLRRDLGADREIAHHDVDAVAAQLHSDVHGIGVGFRDDLAVVLAEAVERGSPQDLHVQRGNVGEPERVVRLCEDGLGQVPAHLLAVHVERRGELDVADVILPQADVHESRNLLAVRRVAIELDPLDERGRAVPHADDGHADLALGLGHVRHAPSGRGEWRRARRCGDAGRRRAGGRASAPSSAPPR